MLSRPPALVLRLVAAWAVASLGAGCLEWNELPAGATGLLAIEGATLSGQIGDVVLAETPTTREVGYSIDGGFAVELTAEEGGQTVQLTLTVLDFVPADVDSVTVTRDGSSSQYLLGASGEKVLLSGCEGPEEGAWDTEMDADSVLIDVERTSDVEQHIGYVATFADGQEVVVDFDMRTPPGD